LLSWFPVLIELFQQIFEKERCCLHSIFNMAIKSKKKKDFWAGLTFIFFGIFAVCLAREYPMGTAVRMGPGYFPSILGGVLAVLGLVISMRSLWSNGELIRPLTLRPLILVLGAVVGFALLLRPLGFVLATLFLVFFSCLGGWQFRLREVALLYIVLIFISVIFFIFALGLQFTVWPA
jgi:hypothetical protein